MGKGIIGVACLLPCLVYGGMSYEAVITLVEKSPSSPFFSSDGLYMAPFRLEEGIVLSTSMGNPGLKLETKWRFRWQTEKDPLYEHEWEEGKRDFRLFPEECFVEGGYRFQYFMMVGKKKWDMSEGFFFKPMLLWADYEAYKRYGEGFYHGRLEGKWGGVRVFLYGVPSRFDEKATNQWYDCFQNGTTNWMFGGAFSLLVGGWVMKGLSLWEVPAEGGKWVSKYALSSAFSWDRWTLYGEAAYKNGKTLVVPFFDGKEVTNIYGMANEITNITPAEYRFEEKEASFYRMFFEGLVGVRVELPWDITGRAEVYYRQRSWGEEERSTYWQGVRYAKEREGNSLYQAAGDIPETYLLLAAGNLSLDTYSPWLVSFGFTKVCGDHWTIDQGLLVEMASYSWQWSGTLSWKSLSLWEVRIMATIGSGKEETFFGALPEGKKITIELTSAL